MNANATFDNLGVEDGLLRRFHHANLNLFVRQDVCPRRSLQHTPALIRPPDTCRYVLRPCDPSTSRLLISTCNTIVAASQCSIAEPAASLMVNILWSWPMRASSTCLSQR